MQSSISQDSFTNFESHVAGNHRFKLPPEPPGIGTVPAAHFKNIAESSGGQDSCFCTLSAQQGIRADGGSVHHRPNPGPVLCVGPQPLKKTPGRILWSGRNLGNFNLLGSFV